jgi:hypothetical protein
MFKCLFLFSLCRTFVVVKSVIEIEIKKILACSYRILSSKINSIVRNHVENVSKVEFVNNLWFIDLSCANIIFDRYFR